LLLSDSPGASYKNGGIWFEADEKAGVKGKLMASAELKADFLYLTASQAFAGVARQEHDYGQRYRIQRN
jgi:hypothetical protein